MLKTHTITLIVNTLEEDKRTTQELADMIIDATMAAALVNQIRWNGVYINYDRGTHENHDR